ncbi:hypothetical protein M3Y96_00363300 [Aphelenchoides besseyi]|nr:hypothetical protein M3Y96_00363300 [Aphelenchoides besseyi]
MGLAMCKTDKVVDEAAKLANQQIEQEIRKERVAERRTIKVLLLGSADSGKSTIAKQMRILHANGFNETELVNYRYMVLTNFCTAYHWRAIQVGITIPDPIFELFLNRNGDILDYPDDEMIETLMKIRTAEFTKEALKLLWQMSLPDNSKYPTENDVIHARASTTGVHEIGFNFRKYFIRLIDVGGQRTERRKWIHCFDSVTAILFVASLSAFDQVLDEEPSKNALDDSVELFSTMYHNEFLRKCSFILFLNKKDILENKLEHVQFAKYFPNYTGKNTYEDVQDYIRSRFMAVRTYERRHIYLHVTNATDRANIDFVFGASCDIILQNNLTRAGMS